MKESNMKVTTRFMLLALLCSVGPAVAVETGLRPTPAEITRLPPYCQAKFNLTPGSPEWKSWQTQIGQNFIDLHHYCAGLNYVNRYWGARSKADRNFYLQQAIGNFDYMAKAEKPGFVLRAELYANRGEAFKLMGKPGEAIKDFEQALKTDPRMVRPYLQLADLYVKSKSQKRALETLTEGLRHVPDSTALQRRYLELGGQKPFPEPLVAKAAEPAPAAPEAATATAAAAAGSEQPAPPPSAAQPAARTDTPPVIGTPKNPYCRFCPPEE